MNNTNLTNKNVVIIGGTSGIGLAVAKLIAKKGANLTIASRSLDRLSQAAETIQGNVQIGQIDTLKEESVKAFFSDRHNIDHIINFAGDSMSGGVVDADLPTAKNAMESKFWGQFYIGRYGGVKINPHGSLTFTGGSGPRPHQAIATMAANAGVVLLVESLAKELAPVRVNVVSPYYVNTPMWSGMVDTERQTLFDRVGKQLPIGRVAEIEDVAPTFLHVLESTYLNGANIPVNGGAMLQTIV